MLFPKLTPPKLTKTTISSFGGINRSDIKYENSFWNTKNTSADHFPLLSTREKRCTLTTFTNPPRAINTKNGITYVLGNSLFYNGVNQFVILTNTERKQIVNFGSYIIIFPDGFYFNTLNLDQNGRATEKGYLSNKITYTDHTIKLIPCILDKALPVCSVSPPENPENASLWLNTSKKPNELMIYSETEDNWASIAPTHICINAEGIDKGFKTGDCISLGGMGYNLDGNNIISDISADKLIISGSLTSLSLTIATENSPFTVERTFPIMDFVCEHQNRLFGCRYGKNSAGQFVNEIYASKLGDPHNWNVFQGLSTDSYAASCGSEGKWTGITSHMGYVVFFKENRMHRLYGTKPSNFTLYEYDYPGIKDNCADSLCLHNGILYYMSDKGLFAYSGSTPTHLSRLLGNESFSNAVAAVSRNVYHICMTDKLGKRKLYTYDIQKNIWHCQDKSNYIFLSEYDSNVIGLKQRNNFYDFDVLYGSSIPDLCKNLFVSPIKNEDNFDWFAESGLLGISTPDSKYLNKIKLRFEAERGSALAVYIQVDSKGAWEEFGKLTSTKLSSYTLHILPPRCDHFKLKICGKGACKIFSLTKITENAGEVT